MRSIFYSVFLAFAVLLIGCSVTVPKPGSSEYSAAIRSFYVGLSAMQVADDERAKTELNEFVRVSPGEPAGWNNLGVLQLRHKDLAAAAESFKNAQESATDNALILRNLYVLEAQGGNYDKAIEYLQKAIATDPKDLKAQFAVAKEYERKNDVDAAAAAFEKVLEIKPDNLPAKLEAARTAAKRGDAGKLQDLLANIDPQNKNWDADTQSLFNKLKNDAESGDLRAVSQNIAFFRNALLRLPDFRLAIAEIKFDEETVGEPILRPIKLETSDFSAAESDMGMAFRSDPLSEKPARWCKFVYLDGDNLPVAAWASDETVNIGDKTIAFAGTNDLITIDVDYNFKNDFVIVGETGIRLISDKFEDITSKATLPAAVLNGRFRKAFAFDIESDGDLDLILASDAGSPIVLQNNSDNTFKQIGLFADLEKLSGFSAADIDEDGDADIAAVDGSGQLHIYTNQRTGQFTNRASPFNFKVRSAVFADTDGDGRIDLNALGVDGTISRAADKDNGQGWSVNEIARTDSGTSAELLVADLDNNGAADIVVGSKIWMAGKNGTFAELKSENLGSISSIADIDGDGRLDLSGLNGPGQPAKLLNNGTKNYAWQVIRPRSAKAEGDQRVNSFGIGSEVEVRSGLFAQKQVTSLPRVHFGLGEQKNVDIMRIVWGNGYVQADFDLKADQAIVVEQRLKGSCPHLFAWNGTKFDLVKDAPPWSPALGLKINAQDTYGILATEEWFKIPGDRLVPKDGQYELRITGEYWETFYIDHYSLIAIDHPEDTEVFSDERFAIPIPPLKVYTTNKTRSFSSAFNDKGEDVLADVNTLDAVYLDRFARGSFQGVAADHFVELTLPEDAPRDKKLWLVADGWVHPTDGSINVQLGQSSKPAPHSLVLQGLSENGDWQTIKKDLGFPAGKLKTVLIDLPPGFTQFRLETNMEIFWDKLAWAEDLDGSDNNETRLELASAEVRYRGFSVIDKEDDSSPELPDYDRILTTNQKWRDLEGYYTRYGDVLELLAGVDDRYIITGAGDEIVLRFPALGTVRPGWKRDFIIVGDGWIKDGDLNSVFSKTVLPLPTHATNDYSRPPTRLEDDPVYQLHSSDWLNFHTRYVAPDRFRNALRTR